MQLAQQSNFVTVENQYFYQNGAVYNVFCANLWQAMNLGAVPHLQKVLCDALDHLKSQGVNNVRIMVGSEGPDDAPFRMSPSLMPSPGKYNNDILMGLDFAMNEISKREMTAVLCLNNYWQWSGGFAQYVQNVTGEDIPYPTGWDRKSKQFLKGSFEDFVQYADRFYKDDSIYTKVDSIFRNHIKTIVERENVFTGCKYRDDTAIFAWELANEPQDPPQKWVSETSAFIKSLDPNHLITVGLESRETLQEFLIAHSPDTIDYCTVHIWAQNRGVYNMMDPSEENIVNAISWGIGWIEKVHQWALKVGKPLILEEFGMPRDNFVAKSPGDVYSEFNPTTRRDRYFKALLSRAADLSGSDGLYRGFGFWSYSGSCRPNDEWIRYYELT
jgi:mannan endo-1,4-beta-mannosidase